MDKFFNEPTEFTPEIKMDASSGKLSIKGKSFYENTTTLYAPVLKWLDEYVKTPAANTELEVQLDYFNTATAKALMDIFRKLEKLNQTHPTVINWLFNEMDEDLEEAGEEYARLIKTTFNLKSFK